MGYLFNGCTSLKSIDISNFIINSYAKSILNRVLSNCSSLEYLDISSIYSVGNYFFDDFPTKGSNGTIKYNKDLEQKILKYMIGWECIPASE